MSRVQGNYRSIGNRADNCGIVFPAEQFCSVRTALRNVASHQVHQTVSFTRSDAWTVEDEQCQKIGGGYEAVKFRFLLFLWMEPTFYLRRSTVLLSWKLRGTSRRARNVEERCFTARKASNGVAENVACGGRTAKRDFWNKARAECSILTGLWILGGLYVGR